MTEEEFLKEWDHFCSRINFKDSAMDARAIVFMNEFRTNFWRLTE